MKLKIVHQNQESREEQVMKEEESFKTEQQQMEDESAKENSPSIATIVSGKRKRKPKEMFDEGSPVRMRKKKTTKPSQSSKSNDGTPDSGGTLMSKAEVTFGWSSTPAHLKTPTMIRAEEVQLNLSNEQPTFSKALVRSHVGSCFWMGLPVPFCKVHLPTKDTEVVLENESGEEFPIKYIAYKTGLSAGWRKFVTGNKLLEGDVLIFQLIGPCRFKVYIIRANDLTEVDGALSLLILDSQTKQNDAEGDTDARNKKKKKKKKHPKSLPLTAVQKNHKEGPLVPHLKHPEEHSGNDSDEVASEVLEGTKSNGSSTQFKDIKNFEEFHIMVNATCVDSELSEDVRKKYYDLCCSKNVYLHERLLPGLYSKLAASMIVETVNIANFIRGCKVTTPRKDFEVWEKSLRSFELLGLNVGFLRARLRRLMDLALDSEGALEVRKYWEAQKDKSSTGAEIRKLEEKIVELKELAAKYDHDVESLKVKAESYEAKFQEEVMAPW